MPALTSCPNCAAALSASAKYCHRCGTARGDAEPGAEPVVMSAGPGSSSLLPWSVAGIAVLSLLAFVAGATWRQGQPSGQGPSAVAPARAPDISQMSPDERADRLFQRVMTYVAQGKDDSVRFFAPMAIQSIAALVPLDAHRRYDLGLLGVVTGDAAMARAEADTILATQPSHLLGLILAMRASGLELDTLARRRFAERFLAALPRERPRALPEYVDHAPDIDAAAREATTTPPSTP